MKLLFFIVFLFITSIVFSQRINKIPPERPKLFVLIVVEQMRADYIQRYWDKLSQDGFRKFYNYGTICTDANYEYAFTQAAPGIATISTGTNPSSHGIIADNWYDRIKEKIVNCVQDDKAVSIGSKNTNLNASPINLVATTIADELKIRHNNSIVLGVSLDPYAAIFSTGHNANGAFWFDNVSGNWQASSFYQKNIPDWLNDFNTKRFADIYSSSDWNLELASDAYLESLPDKNDYEKGYKTRIEFPHKALIFQDIYMKYQWINISPIGNIFTKDVALYAIDKNAMGRDETPDYLSVTFNAMKEIGSRFGPLSVEVEDAYGEFYKLMF